MGGMRQPVAVDGKSPLNEADVMSNQGEWLREGFDEVSAYLEFIQKWHDDLRNIATSTLQMQGIEDGERDNLKRALNSLYSIDELVKIIGEHPSVCVQAHGFHNLWSIIAAAYVIGNRGAENPVTQKFLKDKTAQSTAQARSAKPSTRHRDQINEIVARHCAALWNKNAKRAGNKLGTAKDILPGVNSDLAKLGIKPLGLDGLCKRIVLP
jgi:hypothetical protein